MNRKTLVIVGAGSMSTLWTVRHVCAHSKQFGATRVLLYDRNVARSETTARLCRLMPEFDADVVGVQAVADLSEALPGADAVYCLLRLDADRDREEASRCIENGIHSDATFGPGSVTLALRHGPVILDIARRMEAHCPDVPLLIFTNCVTILTDLVRRHTAIKAIGICPGVENIKSDLLHLHYDPPGPLTGLVYRGGGLNHFSWVTRDSTYEGERLGDYLAKHIQTLDDGKVCPWCLWHYEKRVFEFTGQMPMNNGHLYRFFFYDDVVADEKAQLMANRAGQPSAADPWPERDRLSRKTKIPDYWDTFGVVGNGRFSECPGTKAMFSTWYDLGWEVGLNIPNYGHVAGLPEGCVVEATCRVTAKDCEPLGLDPIPECVKGISQAVAAQQRMVADLVLNPTLKGLQKAIFADPCHRNLEKVETVTALLWESFASGQVEGA